MPYFTFKLGQTQTGARNNPPRWSGKKPDGKGYPLVWVIQSKSLSMPWLGTSSHTIYLNYSLFSWSFYRDDGSIARTMTRFTREPIQPLIAWRKQLQTIGFFDNPVIGNRACLEQLFRDLVKKVPVPKQRQQCTMIARLGT